MRNVSKSRAIGLLIPLCFPSLLTACAGNNVVVEPVALKPVPAALMRSPGVPRCMLPARDSYDAREIIAYADCWTEAYHSLAVRTTGLQRAVAIREAAAQKAVKSAKGS